MITKEEYTKASIALEFLIKEMDLGNNVDAELITVSDIIEEYELINFPIGTPTLLEVKELRMFEMKLKKEK
jgi:HTH-type transcriptional regulator/antitoxin HigA